MNRTKISSLWKWVKNTLVGLGLVFVVLFVISEPFRGAVPGYNSVCGPILDRYWLLMANWKSDLGEGFVWYDKVVKEDKYQPFAGQCKISGYENGLLQWQSPIGTFWLPSEEGVNSLLDMARVIQQDVYTYRGRSVRPGDVVLDCGAHVGSFTRKALDKGASLVIAIEPSAKKVECLRKNFAAEIEAGKVRALQIGVWSKDDKLWLAGMSSVGNTVLPGQNKPGEGPGEWVRVTTLDKVAEEQALSKVDFVKMDIEGAESEALRGARGIIARFRPFLAIGTEHYSENARDVIAVVRQSGVDYKVGFGSYWRQKSREPYSPMEVFFYISSKSATEN